MGKQCDHTYHPVLDLDDKPIGQRCSICHEYNESAAQTTLKTDFGGISKITAQRAATEMLITLQESKFLRALRKAAAIQKIKAQPFFGSVLPKPTGETIRFRRPIPYTFNEENKNG